MSISCYSKRKRAVEDNACVYNADAVDAMSKVCVYEQKIIPCGDVIWDNPYKISKYMTEICEMQTLADEHVYVVALDTKCRVNGIMELAHGGINWAVCSPREVYQAALLMNATQIVLVHNHPSGVSQPSESDLKLKQRMQEAGNIVGIEMVDFIIVGLNEYYSCSEKEKEN